jgi:hypothetical protein
MTPILIASPATGKLSAGWNFPHEEMEKSIREVF